MRSPTILVIDGTEPMLELLGDLLTEEGYSVYLYDRAALSATTVLQKLPDLIVSDYPYADKLAWQWVQSLKAVSMTAHIPLILCPTGPQLINEHGAWLTEHDVLVLEKPYHLDDLLNAVAQRLPILQARAVSA